MSVSEKMKAIADAIREYTNKPDKLTLDEMPNEIHVAAGQAYQDGIRGGTAEGIEQGKKEAYDEFWDIYQRKGDIYSAQYMFAFMGWDDTTFKPKYSMHYINNASNMFNTCGVTNLRAKLESLGITFKFGDSKAFQNMLAYSEITHFIDIDTRKATSLNGIFYYAQNLIDAGEITLKEDGSQTFTSAFGGCNKLENIMIGAPRKGETCSELITVPFNEAFEWIDEDDRTYANLKPEWLDAYAEYITASDSELYPGYLQTYICFETGEHYVAERYIEDIEGGYGFRVPRWWIPKDETQNVSFYLCKNEEDAFTRESIGNNIDFKSCPLSCRSISCIVSALSSTASGKTLTLKKSAVENAFGIDADGYSDDMYWFVLVADKSNEYDGNWTISLV